MQELEYYNNESIPKRNKKEIATKAPRHQVAKRIKKTKFLFPLVFLASWWPNLCLGYRPVF
jgi:hypothetical protein